MGLLSKVEIYRPRPSPLHWWEPRYKLMGFVALILAFANVRDWRLILPMLAITAALYRLAQLPLLFLLQRLRYPGLILLGLVAALPFVAGETILWQGGGLTLRQEGCLALLLISARFISIMTLGLLLLATTPFVTLMRSLRSLGLPSLLVDMTLLTYRYLFDLGETLHTMQTALRLRGFGQQQRLRLGPLAALAGSLLIRSYEQSEQVYRAMRLRGYGSLQRFSTSTERRSPWHWLGFIAILLTALGFLSANFWLSEL